jgi:uncharacterized oligopeptide transporter (OPT) family protein
MKRDLPPILFGLGLTALLSGTFVIAGLKAGITPGVSPLVILSAWGLFAARVSGSQGSRFLNLAQVAGSGGMAVTAGVIFTAPVIQIVYRQRGLDPRPVDILSLIILSLAGALIGVGFVGLTTKKFLSDSSLPAPEARACTTMISVAVTNATQRSLVTRSQLTARGKSHPWPFSTWGTPQKAEVFGGRQSPHPAAAGFFHSLLRRVRPMALPQRRAS